MYGRLSGKNEALQEQGIILRRRVRRIAKCSCWLRHVCPSARMEQLGSHWADLMKFIENLTRKLKFYQNPARIRGVLYEIMSKKLVEPERPHAIRRMRVACWISMATRAKAHARLCAPTLTRSHTRMHSSTHAHTHKYVIFIAFPRQQRFHECASVLCCTYIACLVLWKRE